MYHHLTNCAQDLTEFFDDTLKKNGRIIIESKNIFGRFTAEAISTTALGFKGNCIKNENSKIFELAEHINSDFTGLAGVLKLLLIPIFPSLTKFLNLKIFRKSTHKFFKEFVSDEIKRREAKGITSANDVIQLLIQAKNGQLKVDDDEGLRVKTTTVRKFTNWNDDELVTAQIFIFFAAGFETTSTLMQMMSWELAMNQEVQEELRQEVDEVVRALDGKPVTYEALNKMKMLETAVLETLRKWPPLPFGFRTCNNDCRVETSDGKSYEFKKGDKVQFPFRCIHYNPLYFENPSKYDPHRFSDENKHKIVPGSFLPFGFGPRLCLGNRLAMLETKLVFFTVLSKYTIEACEKTPKEINYAASPLAFKETVIVELKPRK